MELWRRPSLNLKHSLSLLHHFGAICHELSVHTQYFLREFFYFLLHIALTQSPQEWRSILPSAKHILPWAPSRILLGPPRLQGPAMTCKLLWQTDQSHCFPAFFQQNNLKLLIIHMQECITCVWYCELVTDHRVGSLRKVPNQSAVTAVIMATCHPYLSRNGVKGSFSAEKIWCIGRFKCSYLMFVWDYLVYH